MQLADVRMYAQKESRRAARPSEPARPAAELPRRPTAGSTPDATLSAPSSESIVRPTSARAAPGPRRGRRASPPRRGRPSARGPAAAPAARRSRRRRSPPAGVASIRPRPCSAPISRQRSQPSTAGPVEEDDLLHLRARARVRGTSRRPARIASSGPRRSEPSAPVAIRSVELDLDLLVDRLEELALAVEVVVEGAAGDAGGADDLLGADAGVAALGEERPGGGDQGRRASPRSARPGCGDAPLGRLGFSACLTFILSVCSLRRRQDETAPPRRTQ